MAPLVKELQRHPEVESLVCVTAQHRQMLDQVLDVFQVIPDEDLNIMEPGQTLGTITRKALAGLEEVIARRHPDVVLVHGDTTTTFAAALAAFYQQVAIGHVEAGLRTHDKYSPFPEEMNRQLADVLTDLFFAPTSWAADNLLREGKPADRVFVTGNTVVDAMQTTVRKNYRHPVLDGLPTSTRLVYMTAHRRENLGEKLAHICQAVDRLVREFPDIHVVYPVHLNPSVRDTVFHILGGQDRIHLIDPLDVVDNHNFMARAYLILTDSGGIQEEAPSLGVPVLVMRDTTERPEGIQAGTLRLVGTDEQAIYAAAAHLLTDAGAHADMARRSNPYGDGQASLRIVRGVIHHFGLGVRPDPFRYQIDGSPIKNLPQS